MTHTEYRAAIKALDLSQVGAARLFGVDPRTSRRWALGEQPIPRAVVLCLRLMLKHAASVDDAESLLSDD